MTRLATSLLANALRALGQRQGDVLRDRKMRPDGVGLKHHAELALLRRDPSGRAIRRNDLAVDANLAAVGNFQAGDAAQQGGFPRTAGADDDEQLALGDFQVERLDRGDHAVADGEPFVQAADGNHRMCNLCDRWI